MFSFLSAIFSLALSWHDRNASVITYGIIVGTLGTEFLYTVEYDDAEKTLTLVSQSALSTASSWISLNVNLVRYDIADPYNIKVEARIVGGGMCSDSRSIFVNAHQKKTYPVYDNYYYGDARCSTILSVHENGMLKEVIQKYMYRPRTHKIDEATGILSNVSVVAGPSPGSGPRHLVIHRNGNYAYVVLEESGEVTQYIVEEAEDSTSRRRHLLAASRRTGSHRLLGRRSLAVAGEPLSLGDESGARQQPQGVLSVFELSAAGEIANQLFLFETNTSGGFANSVAASSFDDSIAALTDNSTGFVEIWRVDHSVIAHLDIPDGQGCCASAVWLD
ncbi:carboxy-cis,cis-muconate cyclase [Xylaria sp. FL1777]|nr:carboxy-cis,cis-muconate cyclase [Xylaria sp. FL1777]